MKARTGNRGPRPLTRSMIVAGMALAVGAGIPTQEAMAQRKPVAAAVPVAATVPEAPIVQELSPGPAAICPTLTLVTGKSTLLRLDAPIDRISLGNPLVADVTIISPRELYLLGKTFGSTNVILWRKGGQTCAFDVVVNIDTSPLQDKLAQLLPNEKGIRVTAAADSVVLSGMVSSAARVQNAVEIAESYVRNINKGLVVPAGAGDTKPQTSNSLVVQQGGGGATIATVSLAGARVINLLTVSSAQQVMLEVKVAEVSRALLDKLGAQFNWSGNSGGWIYSILTGFLTNSAGAVGPGAVGPRFVGPPNTYPRSFSFDAAKQDGLIKILAEPTIMAISGQEGSFLAGGKIFIPKTNPKTGEIAMEEKEFGVGLKFTPTVLDGGLIHLKVAPEVSELSQTGTTFTTVSGATTVLPSFTTRRAETTVQLYDGQSFAIAGLIKNNVTETVRRFPILGEVPILGALFRSSEFQSDKTELMFLVTPRLVKPLSQDVVLPTDSFTPPTRGEFLLEGKMEGSATEPKPQPLNPPPGKGGFEVK